ncbi:hypothetical protein [Sphingomonas sp. SUN039]|uniref:hypothetical protein n=1 Tax=Sphingomonas sp. SUN039 TaxID=2937787 RepID=UPI002164B906|nr:hypothetical protein [Sphingomonas sp. SUN039]UVO55290.1 hypothetical protein M0209_14585 [Sphingomonas sp. SUN039]
MRNVQPQNPPRDTVRDFFAWSDLLDHDVLHPLAHIKGNWEATWDHTTRRYESEEGSFAKSLNLMIDDIADTAISPRYHDNEDVVARYLASQPGSKIAKVGGRWVGEEYGWTLEQGGFYDIDQGELLTSAIGRVAAALKRDQTHYDMMETGHRMMLADILTIILYHRSNCEADGWSDI